MASPQVAGVAALLLSIKPDLSALQLKNAILNSAEEININVPDGSTQTVKKLNAFNAVKYVLNLCSSYLQLNYNNKYINKTIDGTTPYFIDNNAMVRLGVQNAYDYRFVISSTQPINITFYDYQLNMVATNIIYSNGNCKAEFSKNLSLGGYYLLVSYLDETNSGVISMSIYGPPHSHMYDDWVYYNRTSHIEVCECGATGQTKKSHVIRSSDIKNNKANCLECGHLLDLNLDMATVYSLNDNRKYSINGSYILPSGIVILVDEDINAYFNNTLIFYNKNDIPQMS